ncbi:MAG: GNAT family N-acetyltransferase [Chthoniobacterales bacterium]
MLSVKPLELANLDAAVALFDAQLREHNIVTPLTDLHNVAHAVLADPLLGFVLVAAIEDNLVGFAYAASHLSLEHGGIIGWLEELYVVPEWRGRGIGSRLLTENIARARQLNWRGIELEVVAGHERVIPLYLRHDFQPVSRARLSRIF